MAREVGGDEVGRGCCPEVSEVADTEEYLDVNRRKDGQICEVIQLGNFR